MKHKGKIWAALVAFVALLMIAATYFGSVTVVSTMHATTNGIHITLGEHQASVVRKISPSNLVAVQNDVVMSRTNLLPIYVMADQDSTNIIGRAAIVGRSDVANISHYDLREATTSYAIRQGATGQTEVNSASGLPLNLNVANTTRWRVNSSGTLEAMSGGLKLRRKFTGTNYTTLVSDILIHCTNTTPITITLVAAATAGDGAVLVIKDGAGNAAAQNITVDGNASETIDGATTATLNANWQSISIYSDGANWFLW